MNPYLGYFAALGTSFGWSFSSTFFSMAGRRVSSVIVNRTRLIMAIGFVVIMHWILEGQPFPTDAEPFRWAWLGLSGLIGYIFGDSLLFQAFVMIGPRLSMLLMALVPVFSTALGWVLLGETLSEWELLGVGLTVGGVMLVVADRDNARTGVKPLAEGETRSPHYYLIGVLCGLGGALGQAGGLYASRMGLVGEYSALSGNLIRLVVAATVIWAHALLVGRAGYTFRRLWEERTALKQTLAGSFSGPFIGVWLSLVAVQLAPLGVASTLMSLAPVLLLIFGRVWLKEAVTRRAVAGTVIAIVGSAILFLPAPTFGG